MNIFQQNYSATWAHLFSGLLPKNELRPHLLLSAVWRIRHVPCTENSKQVNMATGRETRSNPVPKYVVGEKVLCYEPDPNKARVLYESKVNFFVTYCFSCGGVLKRCRVFFCYGWPKTLWHVSFAGVTNLFSTCNNMARFHSIIFTMRDLKNVVFV